MQIFSENDRGEEKRRKKLICAKKRKIEIIEKRNELTVNRYLDEKKLHDIFLRVKKKKKKNRFTDNID